MNLQRAVLRTKSMEIDGRQVQVVSDKCVVGSPWLVDVSWDLKPQAMYCGELRQWVEDVPVVFVRHADRDDPGGVLPACLFDIDEAPMEFSGTVVQIEDKMA